MIIVLRVVKELHGPQKEMKLNKTISNIAVVIHSKFALVKQAVMLSHANHPQIVCIFYSKSQAGYL